MAIKKSQLYSSLWSACDKLRGSMEPSEYKNYVLVLLFLKYVSDMYAGEKNALVVVPDGSSYKNLLALTSGVGEGIDEALGLLAGANESLQGVINNETVFFNNEERFGKGAKMDKKLKNLLRTFDRPELDFSKNKTEGDDILGDAYEYFMKNFASESGKSKGNFFTPAEVSRIMAKIIGANNATGPMQTVYDPTCGSGSLLLRVAAESPNGISIYGQESITATGVTCVLNMWLHSNPDADIKYGSSTLSDPMFTEGDELKRFDYVVANPPFSYKEWTDGLGENIANEEFGRFKGFGVPPEKNGDFAFMLHILKSLKTTGKGAVILPHGVLFRGNAEATIRENILKHGYIKGIIGLPTNLFYGTGIPASIIILDKEGAENRDNIFIIDASKGFLKDGNKNRLRERDIHSIVDTFNNQKEVAGYSRIVPMSEIEKNDYNLNIPRYIDSSDVDDIQDIDGHLNGGIPNYDIETLQSYWDVCPKLSQSLFKKKRKGYSELSVSIDDLNTKIVENDDFAMHSDKMVAEFKKWKIDAKKKMTELDKGSKPKVFISDLSESLLTKFLDMELIDEYALYQRLMDYWDDVFQDDAYIIAMDSWDAGKEVERIIKETKKKGSDETKKTEVKGLVGLEGKIVPVSLVVSEYFSNEQKTIESFNQKLEEFELMKTEMIEKYGNDDGEDQFISSAVEDGKIKKGKLTSIIKQYKNNADKYDKELEKLNEYLLLLTNETKVKSDKKKLEEELEMKVWQKYPTLTVDEIKDLVISKKWLAHLSNELDDEITQMTHTLTNRIKDLAERYQNTLPSLSKEVDSLELQVEKHLKTMGFVW